MRDGQDTRRTSPRTGTGTDTVNTASVKKRLKETASTAVDSIQTVPRKSADAARVAAESVTAKSRKALQSITPLADSLLSTTQALLASRLSGDLNALLANMVKGPATIYDKAMDAAFHANPEGGTFHRLFDGSHTPLGAFKAAKDATPDDTMFQEVRGVLQGLFRDVTTPRGLALVTWNKATYEDVAAFLESNMGIPKSWLYEIVTYDAADLLGGIIGVVSTTLCWNRADGEPNHAGLSGEPTPRQKGEIGPLGRPPVSTNTREPRRSQGAGRRLLAHLGLHSRSERTPV